MTRSLFVTRLQIEGFRNIEAIDVELSPRINVIAGDNGQGKTSILEALYFVATSRSFRTERLREVCRDGDPHTRVVAELEEGGYARRQRGTLVAGRRNLFIDDKRAERISHYAVQTPVVVFHPGNLTLVSGAAGERRTLLDRIALYRDPSSGEARSAYQQAQRERQRALETNARASAIDAFEALMAEHGSYVSRARFAAFQVLISALKQAFETMAPAALEVGMHLLPGGSDDPQQFARELSSRRERDRARGSATYGPHRDDVELVLGGRSARHHASQGQQRVLALALKLGELDCVRAASGTQPILLLDDVSSELDPTRTGAVYDVVAKTESQVLVTTTRPELFLTTSSPTTERRDFRVSGGTLEAALNSIQIHK